MNETAGVDESEHLSRRDPDQQRADTPRQRTASIRDFITDGALAELCVRLSEMSGCTIRVRDHEGRVLSPDAGADQPGLVEPIGPSDEVWPIDAADERIGALTLSREDDALRSAASPVVRLLAGVASELCRDVTQLRHRAEELGVLYRLNALLVRGGRVQDTLIVALRSALDVLGLDAGSIVLLPKDADGLARPEDEYDLDTLASVGLTEEWLKNPMPLGRDRVFDRMALAGEVVSVPNLLDDDRVLEPERSEEENVAAFMCAGLVFGDRPLGIIRVYSRTPRIFTAWDESLLRSIAQQAAAAVEQARLLVMRARERRVKRALRVAGAVQQRMLPGKMPRVEPFDVAARYQPSMELGGDFYDLFVRPDGALGIVVGDVVGKGVPSALLMASVRATLRAHADDVDDPADVLGLVNRALCRDTRPEEFATVWYGIANPETLELRWASAGHDPPIMHKARRDARRGRVGGDPIGSIRMMPPGGLVVGVDKHHVYHSSVEQLAPGDALFVYTDGLIDLANFEEERFGRTRLRESVREAITESSDSGAKGVLRRLFWSLRQFAGLAKQPDDQTLVVLRVNERR